RAIPGETTAFIGSTGSGKSTLINLIPRFYDVTKGEILIDGVNIKNVSQYELREKIGFIPQKGLLFSGTLESNLKYGGEYISDEDIEKASEIAQAIEFINNKEERFKTEISQGGSNVSGGQKQRLAIARALAKKAEIFIFDDSFSALDFKTDARLRSAINKELRNSTVLIVAQRISTIMNANQIIVLDEGKVVGKGTHKELMKNCEVYQQIALSQLSKEELSDE
ncbi:MAG: ABC transporter ATP-binding protein, partial [Clostridium sp.]|nr:ABC transporter ATP-binding protein [Clostridium sp.]